MGRVSAAEAAVKRAEAALAAPPPPAEAADPAAGEAEKAKLKSQLQKIEREIAQRKNAKSNPQADSSETAKQIINIETQWSRLTREQSRARQRLSDLEGK